MRALGYVTVIEMVAAEPSWGARVDARRYIEMRKM